jgi:hypothetical protein
MQKIINLIGHHDFTFYRPGGGLAVSDICQQTTLNSLRDYRITTNKSLATNLQQKISGGSSISILTLMCSHHTTGTILISRSIEFN